MSEMRVARGGGMSRQAVAVLVALLAQCATGEQGRALIRDADGLATAERAPMILANHLERAWAKRGVRG